MTNTRKKQVRTLAILLIAVVALTVGFAAFTSSLRIKTRLSVNPNKGTFNVKFSKEANSLVEDNVIPTKSSDIFEAFPGIIDNSGIPTISDLGGEFTQPGESITYEFYALNTGEYKAYLTDVIFGNVDGEDTNKVCTSLDGTHQSEVDVACSNISIKVTVGSDILTTTRSNLVGHNLEPNVSEKVKVEITYSSGGILPEVPFEVSFGDISMVYNSLEASDTTNQSSNGFETDYPPTCYLAVSDGNGGATIIYYNSYADDCPSDLVATEPVIPSSLPIYEVSFSFNNNKCLNYVDVATQYGMSIGGTPQDMCDEISNSSMLDANALDGFNVIFLEFGPMLDITYTKLGDQTYSVTEIGNYTFYNVEYDEEIKDILLSIGYKINPALTSVTLPNSLTRIGGAAFEDNDLTSITIPNSVTEMGWSAFEDNHLTSINFGTGLIEISSSAFYGNNLTNVTLPNSLKLIADSAFEYNQLTTLTISSSVESIGYNAFSHNNLTSITIPNSVTNIGGYAFSYNKLTSVEIGSGITNIGSDAFGAGTDTYSETNTEYGPNALTSVTIHVPSTNAENFTSYRQFGWAEGYSNSNIVWSDS